MLVGLTIFFISPKIKSKNLVNIFKQDQIKTHVHHLSQIIGERNITKPPQLQKSADYIKNFLKNLNLKVETQKYEIQSNKEYLPIAERKLPFTVENIYVTLNAQSKLPHLVVGAHYDTFFDTPGADDNASSVSVLLEMIKQFASSKTLKRPIDFVFFTLEEPPFFQTNEMGSYQFAKMLQSKQTKILGMISLDCLGYFSESQSYPFPLNLFYKSKGDFISLISSWDSFSFYKKVSNQTYQSNQLKLNNFSLPSQIPGVTYSDHWSFEQFSYPAVLFTDSAFYRSSHYHENTDHHDTLNYEKLTEFTNILYNLIQVL